MDSPKISVKESSQKEKQTVVDPMSLKESSIKQGFFETSLPIFSTTKAAIDLQPPPLRPPKPKFLSLSLPNSANSSPRLTSGVFKKKSKARSMESPCQASNLTLKHHHLQQEINLRRSKSCGEGRASAPSDEFDLWLTKLSVVEHDNWSSSGIWCISAGIIAPNKLPGSFSKIEAIDRSPASGKDPLEVAADKGFKCSALCLYLPGFGKAKPIKARKEGQEMEGAIISRTVSLEKFECGSWASSALFHEIAGGDSKSTYFDLPMELIKSNANDVDAPITSAFVFEKDLKGALKNGSSRTSGRRLDMSPRHIRFSTSSSISCSTSPTSCITPRLRKAREDFNAFLEAQSA